MRMRVLLLDTRVAAFEPNDMVEAMRAHFAADLGSVSPMGLAKIHME